MLLTFYLMLCFTVMKVFLKLVTLLWTAAWQTIDLLDYDHASAMTARIAPRAQSSTKSAGSTTGG